MRYEDETGSVRDSGNEGKEKPRSTVCRSRAGRGPNREASSIMDTNNPGGKVPVLYFGKNKGQPLSAIPISYLEWVLWNVKLSSRTRTAIVAELASRGVVATAPVPPRRCHRCGSTD